MADLGIIHSADNTFHDHITATATKGRRLVGLCWRPMQSRDPFFMLRIYITYIMPVRASIRFIYMVTVSPPRDGRIRSNKKIVYQKTI